MEQKFNYVRDVSDDNSMDVIEVNEVAIEIMIIDYNTSSDKTYVMQLSILNKEFYTDFTMNNFIGIIKKVSEDIVRQFIMYFVEYHKDKTSSYKLSLSLHTLYAYSLGFIPKPIMMIRQTISKKNGAIIFQIGVINQKVYAVRKEFLNILFASEKELGYDFLVGLIDDLTLGIKFSDYYKKGITTNPEEIQEHLNKWVNG